MGIKTKGNKNYRNGRALEYKVIKELEGKGFTALRTAGSHGVADIVAFRSKSLPMSLIDPMSPKDMVEAILEGWMRLPPDKVLGDFLYGGQRFSPNGKLEYDIHVFPVMTCLIQCKRRKRG